MKPLRGVRITHITLLVSLLSGSVVALPRISAARAASRLTSPRSASQATHTPRTAMLPADVAVPAGLPRHFSVGLVDSDAANSWMPNSGIPWDYAYRYLSQGWPTFAPNGTFVLDYAQTAAAHNYLPVFTFFEMLPGGGSCMACPGEARFDLSHLNDPTHMAGYFHDFRLLMQRLGPGTYNGVRGFGHTVIVHIEPDLSAHALKAVMNTGQDCYGFCTAQGNNPAFLKAAVARTGDPDVASYPNTYQGYNWALLHLRDKYAPNVILAFNASNWGPNYDIATETVPSLDVTGLAQQEAKFASQSGVTNAPSGTSTYNVLINDPLNGDAGYWTQLNGKPSGWWDRLNVLFPNFHRWESYVKTISQATGRSVLLWEVPEGNQYFDTENNSPGHYQDNHAEYFFAHVGELVQSGIIGMMFGPGHDTDTVHYDRQNDGVTNPRSFCTSLGMGSGQICNNHTSTVADDDGGYIRMQARQYYASGGYPLH